MSRRIKWLLGIAVALIVLVSAMVIYVPSFAPQVVRSALGVIATAARIEIKCDDISVSHFFDEIGLSNLRVSQNGESLFRAKRAKIGLSPWLLLKGTYPIKTIVLDEPFAKIKISFEETKESWDLEKSVPDEVKRLLQIGQIEVSNANLILYNHDTLIEVNQLSLIAGNYDRERTLILSAGPILGEYKKLRETVFSLKSRFTLRGGRFFEPKQVLIHNFDAESTFGNFHADGISDRRLWYKIGSWPVQLNVEVTGRLGKWLFPLIPDVKIDAQTSIAGNLKIHPGHKKWDFRGNASAYDFSYDELFFPKATISIDANNEEISVIYGKVYVGKNDVTFGFRTLLSGAMPIFFHADTQSISLYQLLEQLSIKQSWVNAGLAASVTGVGQLHPFHFNGQVTGRVRDFANTAGPFPNSKKQIVAEPDVVQLQSNVWFDENKIKFSDATLSDRFSHAQGDATIYFDEAKGMELDAKFAPLNFRSIENDIADLIFRGEGTGQLSIRGAYDDLKMQGSVNVDQAGIEEYDLGTVSVQILFTGHTLQLSNISASPNNSKLTAQASLNFEKAGHVKIMAEGEKLNISDFPFIFKRVKAGSWQSYLRDMVGSGSGKGRLELDGTLDDWEASRLTGAFSFTFDKDLHLWGQPLARASGEMLLTAGMMEFKQAHLMGMGGQIDVTGYIDMPKDMMNLQGQVKDISLNKFVTDKTNLKLAGIANGFVKMQGPIDKLTGSGNIQISALSVSGAEIGEATFGLRSDGNHFILTADALSSKLKGEMKVSQDKDHLFDANVSLSDTNFRDPLWASWAPDGLVGDIVGHAQIVGNIADMNSWSAKISVEPSALSYRNIRFDASPITGNLKSGQLVIAPVTLSTSQEDEVQVKGTATMHHLDFSVDAKGDSWLVPYFVDQVQAARGAFDAHLRIVGPLNEPSINGTTTIKNGYFSTSDAWPDVEHADVSLLWTGHRIDIERVIGRSRDGLFEAFGGVTHKHWSLDASNISMKVSRFPIEWPEWLVATLDGNLSLNGNAAKGFRLGGNIDLMHTFVTKNLTLDDIRRYSSKSRRQRKGTKIELDVGVKSIDNIVVENANLSTELKANVKVKGTAQRPIFTGNIAMVSFGSAFFRNQNYRLLKARFDLEEATPNIPRIDLEAESQVGEYEVSVRIEGKLDKPNILLRSTPSRSQSDLSHLLTFGFFPSEVKDATGSAGIIGLDAISSLTGISEQLQKYWPVDPLRRGGFRLDELSLSSMYLATEGIYLPAFTLGISIAQGWRLRLFNALTQSNVGNYARRLEMEQTINRHWRWKIAWDSDGSSNLGDAGADVWYRWEF